MESSESGGGGQGGVGASESGGWSRSSIPEIFFRELDAVLSQQLAELILERYLLMVFRLIGDIAPHLLILRPAHRECAIAGLPGELFQGGKGLVNPQRGLR